MSAENNYSSKYLDGVKVLMQKNFRDWCELTKDCSAYTIIRILNIRGMPRDMREEFAADNYRKAIAETKNTKAHKQFMTASYLMNMPDDNLDAIIDSIKVNFRIREKSKGI